MIPIKDIADLVTRAQAGEKKCRDRLVMEFQPLVGKIARKVFHGFKVPGTTSEDLQQEGTIGLLLAIDRYDSTRGANFITCATLYIRCYLLIYAREAQPVRLRGKRIDKVVWRARSSLSNEELAEIGNLPTAEVQLIRAACNTTLSTNAPQHVTDNNVGAEDAANWIPGLRSDMREEIVESIDTKRRFQALEKAKKVLPDRVRQLFEARFRGETLENIGERFGLSRERVRQLEARALRTLKDELVYSRLDDRNNRQQTRLAM